MNGALMIYKKRLLLLLIVIFSCDIQKKPIELWNEALENRSNNNFSETIIILNKIIDHHPNDSLAVMAYFQIADIYLNDVEDYEHAIELFNTITSKYPEDKLAKKSQFMIGYVYNNYLNAYSDAISNYQIFLNNYPDDDLIPSVKYELEELMKIEETIKRLSK
tara:strand:+ start:594 stop:1082 length:489 start_codon:yes stop_codon:yes gene_type:complete